MTGDPRVYCIHDMVCRAVDLNANEIRVEASVRGVRTVYLRDGRVIDVKRIPGEFFRSEASVTFQSPFNYLNQYRLGYDLCLAYREEHTGSKDFVHFSALGPCLTGPDHPTRPVDVSATMTESRITSVLKYNPQDSVCADQAVDAQRGKALQSPEPTIRAPVPDAKAAPCPFCAEALRTPMAKQCRFCKMDWHDPNNVYRRG
jgi:hypothetical protein